MALRDTLQSITNSRDRLIKITKGRTDWDKLKRSVNVATDFLRSYPVADDVRVANWCRTNEEHVDRLLTSKQRPTLKPLLMGMKP
jgi:hypothetical protein